MTEHPINPPLELVQQWAHKAGKEWRGTGTYEQDIATQAARWGSDQELEACCEWLGDAPVVYNDNGDLHPGAYLRDARRPKPPTLNEVALQMLGTIERDAHYLPEITDTIRRALEALPE